MKLLIFGSRSCNKDLAYIEIDKFCINKKVSHIVTAGEPDGACCVARKYAEIKDLPLTLYFKQKNRAQGMYHWRSVLPFKDCEFALFYMTAKAKELIMKLNWQKKWMFHI